MKRTLLSVKEIAPALGVSSKSIRRAYWRGDIPTDRITKMLRFDLARVQRIFWPKDCQRSYGHVPRDRRQVPAARTAGNAPVR